VPFGSTASSSPEIDLEVAYRPGEQRGGDFYVCSTLADGSAGLLIGDVTGHGPEAAAFAASLRSAWAALLLTPAPLEEHMRRLNQVAFDRQPSAEMFATALACTVAALHRPADRRARRARLAALLLTLH